MTTSDRLDRGAPAATGSLTAGSLRCERQFDPLGVHLDRPALSWIPAAGRRDESQTAYRVIAATDPALLSEGTADLWDSGRVDSDAVSGVTYAGEPLGSRSRCWWAVQLWDRDDEAGPWSAPAAFELGLLRPDDWNAEWIGDHVAGTAPLLRREFVIPSDVRLARAYVTGLGYYELRLNGRKVGDRVLDPAQTTYDHDPELRDAEGRPARIRSPRVLYTVFDITDGLRPGTNTVGMILGNGWYSQEQPDGVSHRWGDRARGLVQLEVELAGGERVVVGSDATWRVGAGPIVADNPVHGEHHDARLEQDRWDEAGFDDSRWAPAAVVAAPGGTLSSPALEPIRVIETLAPVGVTESRANTRIIDFGQHVSGWTRIRVSGSAGAQVTLRHAGEVDEAGELDDRVNMFAQLPARQTDVYVLKGTGSEVWEPRFTLHGFRYVEVTCTGDAQVDLVEARVVHSDVAAAGAFHCSDELLNRIDRNVRWTYRASFQGYPQDAADRGERYGWLGEPGWVIEDYLYVFDSAAFWVKWLDDIRDTQLADGSLPVVAPVHMPSYLPWPDWAITYVLIAWHLYFFTADRTIIERHYEGMRSLLDWFSGLAVDGIVEAGLGDHMEPQPDGTCTLRPQHTPVAFSSTAWLSATADLVANAALVVGDAEGAESARALAGSARDALNAAFFDEATGRYATGSQTSMALPLWFGLVPAEHRERVAANLVEQIVEHDRDHLTTGTFGTPALEQVLANIGAAEVMYRVATQTDFPSWGDQIRQGATTIWESWGHDWMSEDGSGAPVPQPGSRNMKLLASISKFLYKDVAGICPTAPGWQRMRVKPALTHVLVGAEARVRTARGDAAIAWRREAGEVVIELEVPATSRADVWLPVAGMVDPVVREGETVLWAAGQPSSAVADLSEARRAGDHICVEVGGGTYRFAIADASAPRL